MRRNIYDKCLTMTFVNNKLLRVLKKGPIFGSEKCVYTMLGLLLDICIDNIKLLKEMREICCSVLDFKVYARKTNDSICTDRYILKNRFQRFINLIFKEKNEPGRRSYYSQFYNVKIVINQWVQVRPYNHLFFFLINNRPFPPSLCPAPINN